MASNDNRTVPPEQRWLAALEALGPQVVAGKLQGLGTNYGRGADVMGIVDSNPHPSRAYVENWLAEKRRAAEALERSRFRWVVWLAVAAAIFSAIAAWPILRSWLG